MDEDKEWENRGKGRENEGEEMQTKNCYEIERNDSMGRKRDRVMSFLKELNAEFRDPPLHSRQMAERWKRVSACIFSQETFPFLSN